MNGKRAKLLRATAKKFATKHGLKNWRAVYRTAKKLYRDGSND